MTAADIEAFLLEHFPAAVGFCKITAIRSEPEDEIDCLVPFREDYLRPGGTLSGPTLMTLADTALYFLLLAKLGPVGLAVTTHLDINFLRKPTAGDVRATGRLLKLGKQLAVGEVHIRDAENKLVAQASVTYSLPPR